MHPFILRRSTPLVSLIILLYSSALLGQSGRIYHYFTFDGEGKVDFIFDQNNYGRPEMLYRIKPGYGYGLGYGVDIGNRHKIQTALRYVTGGQYYKDVFAGLEHVKNIEFYSLQMPLIYKFIFNNPSKTYRKDFQWILNAGVNFSYLIRTDATYRIDGQTVSFYDFMKYNNSHYDEILANPDATDPISLFNRWDIALYGGVSALYFVLDYVAVELELNVTYGMLDINRLEWQIKNVNGQYSGSHNGQIGSRLTVLYYIPFW